jgi:hypothetical protein
VVPSDPSGYPNTEAGPHTFQDVFSGIYKEAFDLLVNRQKKYGPENIRMLGLYGTFGRLADDKIERIRRGMNGKIVHGKIEMDVTDFDDESFEDALLDIANYALIMIALKRGLWGKPLDEK